MEGVQGAPQIANSATFEQAKVLAEDNGDRLELGSGLAAAPRRKSFLSQRF
jgi:hypothetical protein